MTAALVIPETLPKEQIDLVRRTIANGATPDELALFLYDCQRRGVHPLDKLLHFTKRGGRYTPVTSIDFMRSQAAATGEMAGSDEPIFRVKPDATGVGHLDLDSATVTVYRLTQGQRFAYTATARWSEYCPDNAPMWKRMPHTMLGKCAEALALRKAFPQQLAGLYSREEMDQADKTGSGFVVEAPVESHGMGVKVAPRQPSSPVLDPVGPAAPPEASPVGVAPEPDVDDLVEGAVLLARVEVGTGRTKATVVTHQGESLAIYDDRLATLAMNVCQERAPVRLDIKVPESGKSYVKAIHRLSTVTPEPVEPPKDLPF